MGVLYTDFSLVPIIQHCNPSNFSRAHLCFVNLAIYTRLVKSAARPLEIIGTFNQRADGQMTIFAPARTAVRARGPQIQTGGVALFLSRSHFKSGSTSWRRRPNYLWGRKGFNVQLAMSSRESRFPTTPLYQPTCLSRCCHVCSSRVL